jgi:hypothetical protein
MELGFNYLHVCLVTLDGKKFASMLADDVTLEHKTNGELKKEASRAPVVSELFNRYIFSNTPKESIKIKAFNSVSKPEYVEVNLDVDEDKIEETGRNRYNFIEHTRLFIRNNQIVRIETIVHRTPLNIASSWLM